MGISILYKGTLANANQLSQMIEEVLDVAKANDWKYFIFENEFPNNSFSQKPDRNNLYGISISPPECEIVSFTFLSNGKMCGAEKIFINKYSENIEDDENLYFLSTKTQYAGIEIHKKIILLFDYLNTKYFENFELTDEGLFWETRDEELLKDNFRRYTDLIENIKTQLDNTPKLKDEKTEDYIFRIVENVKREYPEDDDNHNEEELPKLDIYQEIEFKKMKLSIEHDASFINNQDTNIPPEIENQFLDYIANFENASKSAKQISVFEKLNKPKFKPAETLDDNEISIELERIEQLMHDNGINLDVLADYENEERLIYTFITKELFLHKIDDINLPGMNCCFIYEEFHPNAEYDLKRETEDFLKMFFDKKNDFYKKWHSKDATNHILLNNFRSLFKKFKMLFFEFTELSFNEKEAIVKFNIDFWGKMKTSNTKTTYSGDGNMTFKKDYGYWYLQEVTLPI